MAAEMLDHLHEREGALLHPGAAGRPARPAAAAARRWPARSAPTSRSAAATPIEPARNPNSQATTATRRPRISPSPVSTDSSTTGLLLRGGQLARRTPRGPRRCTGGVSQERNDPRRGPGRSARAAERCLPIRSPRARPARTRRARRAGAAAGASRGRRRRGCRRSAAAGRAAGPARRGVLDVDQQALGEGLVPGVHVVEGAHLAGGDADRPPAAPARPRRRPRTSACSITAISSSRSATRSPVAWRTASSSMPSSPDSRRHSPSLPQAICTGASAVWNRPYGAIDGVVVARPRAGPRGPPSTGCPGRRAHRPPRRAGWCARPGRGRSPPARAARRAPRTRRTSRPAGRRSARRPWCGSSGDGPVSDISPASPCAIWS